MANPNKGEALLKVGEVEYTLVFDINNLCSVEGLLDKTIGEIFEQIDSLRVIRALIWGGLRTKHPEVTLEQAGAIVETIGGAGAALDLLGQGLTGAMPEAKEGNGSRPRKGAGAGIGLRSSSRGSKLGKTPKRSGAPPLAS